MKRHPGLRISEYDKADLVNEALVKGCGMDLSRNGFLCKGIYPLNRNIFSDIDFLPSQVTEIPETANVETVRSKGGGTAIVASQQTVGSRR